MPNAVFAVVFAVVALGCGGDGNGVGDECGDVRVAEQVFHGTLDPTHVPLTAGQIMAIGTPPLCSGTLIAPTWVLTADHCGLRAGDPFCIGSDPSSPDQCFASVQVVSHPSVDLTLMELEVDVTAAVPGVEPIPIMTEPMDASWIGQIAENAGYGSTETGSSGTRFFVAETIQEIGEFVTVNGAGMHGVCFGDSGGPSMVIATDGSVRVAGALSFGDASCVDVDNFTRVDTEVEWVESFTGPTVGGAGGCGSLDAIGRCVNGNPMWCDGVDTLRAETCADGTSCGWDDAEGGFRCIAGPDPCEGVDRFGACDGEVARWCEDGVPLRRDCTACGQTCGIEPGVGTYCVADPCMGLDFLGRCNGDVAEWCDDGVFRSRDCGADGLSCDFIDDTLGFYCVDP